MTLRFRADGATVVGWSWPPAPVADEPRRCHCGRPVLPTSLDGTNCSEHDDELPRGTE